MNEKEYAKWAEIRTKGPFRFIILAGVILWGLPMFLCVTFLLIRPFKEGFSLGIFSFNLVTWLFGGALFGLMVWKSKEKEFKKFQKTQKTQNSVHPHFKQE